MKLIKITEKHYAQVDDADYLALKEHHWTLVKADKTFYAQTTINGDRVLMHRFIMQEDDPAVKIDHGNGNGLNNQRRNLRKCTHAENMQNRQKHQEGTTSQYKGVYRMKPKLDKNGKRYDRTRPWKSYINIAGKSTMIGAFLTEIEAAEAYNEKAVHVHGKFAKLNVITKPVDKVGQFNMMMP